MRTYLVVANQTLPGQPLLEAVQRALAAGECSFHVLVPATRPSDHLVYTEGRARALATDRLDETLARLRAIGADATGEVGDEHPMVAIGDVLRHRPIDRMIISTLPAGVSRWLRQDLPNRAERRFEIPVEHVVTESAAAERH